MLEAEMQREMQFDEEKTTCKTLILHMQKLLDPEATSTSYSNGVDVVVNLDPQRPQRSQSSPAARSTRPTANSHIDRESECTIHIQEVYVYICIYTVRVVIQHTPLPRQSIKLCSTY